MLCKMIAASGKACGAYAGQSGYCYMHDPARAVERAAARRLGGRRRRAASGDPGRAPEAIRDIAGVLDLLDFARLDALRLENSVARGRLLVAMAGAYLAALQVGELEERVRALEALYHEQKTR